MEVPRSGDALCAPRLCVGLQTDHPRPALVLDPAALDDHHVYGHLRPDCQPADRWPAAVPVLYVRDGGLGLFRRLPEQDIEHFCAKRQSVRQGLFPAHGCAGLDLTLEPDHFPDPVWHVPGLCGVFCAEWHTDRAQLVVGRALAAADGDDGRLGAGLRDHHFFADHQVSRPALSRPVWCAAFDVCHSGHLPGFGHPGPVAVGYLGQPDDAHRRGFPLRLPGGGDGRPRAFALQLGLYGRGCLYWSRHLQPRRADVHGYGVA